MSPNMKLAVLAFVGAAAAVPQNNQHGKFHHKPSGYVGPSGGWAPVKGTGVVPSGTAPGTAAGTGIVGTGGQTTTLASTSTSTQTVFSTVFVTRSKSAGVDAASAGATECGPATVYVTATNKVTVTVPAAGGAASSGSAPSAGGASSVVEAHVPNFTAVAPEVPSPTPIVSSVEAAPSPVEASSSPPVEASSSPSPVEASSSPSPVEASSSSIMAAPPVASSSVMAAPPVASSAQPTPVSSAAASSTPSSSPEGHTGGKRGIAYRWDGAAAAKSYAKSNMGFAWNWESDPRGDIGGQNFIPTLRTLANLPEWKKNVDAAIKNGSTVVFGLNEPDRPDQANLKVTDACTAWIENMNNIAQDNPHVTVVGPSVSNGPGKDEGLSWLQDFKNSCKEAVWHQANIHWYDTAAAGFDGFKAHVEKAISQFGKVWVSEFALNEGSSVEDSAAFLEKAQKYLDGNDDCVGYSYFAAGNFPSGHNLLGTADAPTEVGKVYLN